MCIRLPSTALGWQARRLLYWYEASRRHAHSPRTVEFLRSLGHDVLRVDEVLAINAPDEVIVAKANEQNRTILTQDLDFSAIIALTGKQYPSLISLRLSSSRIEHVNSVLDKVLPSLEEDVLEGMIIAVEDRGIRRRNLPIEHR